MQQDLSVSSHADVEATQGPMVIEFGASWCGICRFAQPLIAGVRAQHRDVRYVKVEDGPGKPLGRAFRVKLWPTLVFLLDGREVVRVVRPRSAQEIAQAFDRIDKPH